MKKCSYCNTTHPLSDFSTNPKTGELYSMCEKAREQKKQYRKDNAEKIREHDKQYYKDNAEKIREYRKDNAEKIREYDKQYYKDNAEKKKQYRKDNAEKRKQYYKDNAEKQKQYRKDNAEKISDRRYRSRYGKTIAEKRQMWLDRDGLCDICHKPMLTAKDCHLDHNHKTGKVRGLLHRKCNLGIGYFQDSISIAQGAVEYLKRFEDPLGM